MRKIWIILQKEWWDLRGQKGLWISFLIFPLVMVLAGGSSLAASASSTGGGIHIPVTGFNNNPLLAGLSQAELAQTFQGAASRTIFFMIPMVVSTILAAHSVAGEKAGRTLEPVLATPLRTWQLLAAKSLAALIPTTIATWLAGLAYGIEVGVMALSPRVFGLIITPGWVAAMLITVPIMGLIPIGITVIVSSRSNDVRTAQQISTLIGLALGIGLIFVTTTLPLTLLTVLGIAVLLLLVGAGIIGVATWLFQREVILTRWA
jgi:ABC-2 type transport system permease protein